MWWVPYDYSGVPGYPKHIYTLRGNATILLDNQKTNDSLRREIDFPHIGRLIDCMNLGMGALVFGGANIGTHELPALTPSSLCLRGGKFRVNLIVFLCRYIIPNLMPPQLNLKIYIIQTEIRRRIFCVLRKIDTYVMALQVVPKGIAGVVTTSAQRELRK